MWVWVCVCSSFFHGICCVCVLVFFHVICCVCVLVFSCNLLCVCSSFFSSNLLCVCVLVFFLCNLLSVGVCVSALRDKFK